MKSSTFELGLTENYLCVWLSKLHFCTPLLYRSLEKHFSALNVISDNCWSTFVSSSTPLSLPVPNALSEAILWNERMTSSNTQSVLKPRAFCSWYTFSIKDCSSSSYVPSRFSKKVCLSWLLMVASVIKAKRDDLNVWCLLQSTPGNSTLYNSNLPLTRTNFHFPSDHFPYNFTLDDSNFW